MAPPPTGPSSSSSSIPTGPSSLRKAPPSGPRAQQGSSGPSTPTGPAASRPQPVAIPFGSGKFRRGGGSHQHFGRQPLHAGRNGDDGSAYPRSSFEGVPTGPQAESGRRAIPTGPQAESSRQAQAKSAPTRPSSIASSSYSRKDDSRPSRPRHVNEEDELFRAQMLATAQTAARTPISIAFPTLQLNGSAKAKPPDLPPPPPSDRPPTPPLGDASPTKPPASTPPPPPDDEDDNALPPPPPPPPDSSPPSPPPPVPTKAAPALPPKQFSLPAKPGIKNAPPAFHFREIPVRRRSPTPEEDEDEPSSSRQTLKTPLAESPPLPPREPTPPPSPPREPTPEPREPTPPPYTPPAYVAPSSTSHRPGLGNFRILYDPATDEQKKGGKEVKKRLDGHGISTVSDPRTSMPVEVQRRGRGPAKQRTEFHELAYTWDANSVGDKPPPPPCAVLITGLNPLTTTDQISKFLRPHGRIREMDAKMDTKSGMQLGICWVKFDTPSSSSGKSAHDIATTVVRVCDGQRIRMQGDEKIKVVLDGRGLRAQRAVKEEMERRYKPKPKPAPPPPPTQPAAHKAPAAVTSTAATPSSGGANTPQTDRPSSSSIKATPLGLPNRPTPRPIPFFNNRNYASLNRAQPIRPPLPPNLPSRPPVATRPAQAQQVQPPPNFASLPYVRGDRYVDLRDSWSPRRDRSRSRSRSHSPGCSTCSSFYSESESEDDRYYRPRARRRRTPSPRRPRQQGPSKEEGEALERVKKALAENGKSHIFIDEKTLSTKDASMSAYLRDHFRHFHPDQILNSPKGWYILFDEEGVAQKAAVLNGMSFRGNRLTFVTEVPASATTRPATATATEGGQGQSAPGQKAWRFLTITKKNRPARAPSPKKVARKRLPSFSSSSSSSESELSEAEPEPAKSPVKEVQAPQINAVDVASKAATVVESGKKRPAAKTKTSQKAKKAKLEAAPLVEIPPPDEQPVAEIDLKAKPVVEEEPVPAKPKKAAPSPLDKLIESGSVVDEEDAYWLGQALQELEPVDEDAVAEQEAVGEDHPLYHQSGSWRAEGFKSIPKIRKSEYLPQQNKAAVSQQHDTSTSASSSTLTSGRTARVTGRRLAHDIETSRKQSTLATQTSDTDTFAFNQLRTRKKQLKFSRSPIEGYGLYAMETILPGEMVCEYVGEIVRSAVAEVREQRYLKQGIGSSYLFRIDGDVVCDATFRGSVSRLINHSCDPSASAKIITINGQSKIVIYAKTALHPGQEILYDYKFPLEDDPALRVPCLCGAATCRGWLN